MAKTVQCPTCSTRVEAGAQFCPKCGAALPVNLAKARGRIPVAGTLFLAGLLIGPAMIVAGVVWGSSLLLYLGIALSVGVVLALVVGEFL